MMRGLDDVQAVLDRLRRYVEMESPSGDEARALLLADAIADDLAAAGADVERIPAPGWGVHVHARLRGHEAGQRPLLLLGHLDTVHPVGTLRARPFVVRRGRAEGPGTYDMKAGVAVIVEALARLTAAGSRPHRDTEVLITCDEEIGSSTSAQLIEQRGRAAAMALVLEPSLQNGAAKTSRKGVANYRISAHGRAAHAGVDPERGVSAIVELAHQVIAAVRLGDAAAGTTVNIGTIRGGTMTNVVPEQAVAEIDVRFVSAAEGARYDAAIRRLEPVSPGARLEIEFAGSRPPLERTEAVVRLYEHARRVAAELGWELAEGSTGGASDGSLVAALGTPTLDGLGPRGGGAHAVDEHVVVDDLPRRVALIQRLLETL